MRLLRIALLAGLAGAACGQKIQIKVGTAAPEGSPWHQILQRTREDWNKLSGGTVSLSIYAGGVLGDEVEMIRKTRIGQLQAVGVSGVGLSHIEPGVGALAIPMLVDSFEEFDYLRDRLAPRLEPLLEKKGFVVLQWSDVGWVHFFSKAPVRLPADLRKLKLFTSAGDPEAETLYREFGMRVVPISITDMLPSLQTNLIEAFDVPPLFALLDQSFGLARNMIDVKWAALSGATLISRRVWEAIPGQRRAELLNASRAAAARSRAEVRKLGDDAILEMKKRGLAVVSADAATLARWRAEAEATYPKMRGRLVPADLFDEAIRLRNEFRAARGAGR